MATVQHLTEKEICIIVTFISTLGVLIIHPCVDDDFTFLMEAKEQPVLLEEFGAKPVFVFFPKCFSLAIFRPARVLRDYFECKFIDCGKAL